MQSIGSRNIPSTAENQSSPARVPLPIVAYHFVRPCGRYGSVAEGTDRTEFLYHGE